MRTLTVGGDGTGSSIHQPRRAAGAQPRGDHMATLTAWKFSTPQVADIALENLQKLDSEQLINVQDAAVVSWEGRRQKAKARELPDSKKAGALGGGFWGLVFGLIFFVPILGLALGAATGALFGSI